MQNLACTRYPHFFPPSNVLAKGIGACNIVQHRARACNTTCEHKYSPGDIFPILGCGPPSSHFTLCRICWGEIAYAEQHTCRTAECQKFMWNQKASHSLDNSKFLPPVRTANFWFPCLDIPQQPLENLQVRASGGYRSRHPISFLQLRTFEELTTTKMEEFVSQCVGQDTKWWVVCSWYVPHQA